jgi:hypothetical protein
VPVKARAAAAVAAAAILEPAAVAAGAQQVSGAVGSSATSQAAGAVPPDSPLAPLHAQLVTALVRQADAERERRRIERETERLRDTIGMMAGLMGDDWQQVEPEEYVAAALVVNRLRGWLCPFFVVNNRSQSVGLLRIYIYSELNFPIFFSRNVKTATPTP